jgi:hypothetical protein
MRLDELLHGPIMDKNLEMSVARFISENIIFHVEVCKLMDFRFRVPSIKKVSRFISDPMDFSTKPEMEDYTKSYWICKKCGGEISGNITKHALKHLDKLHGLTFNDLVEIARDEGLPGFSKYTKKRELAKFLQDNGIYLRLT